MIVVDTNIIAYYHLRTIHSHHALKVFAKDSYWIAPHLWKSEFKNVLAINYRHNILDISQAKEIYQDALDQFIARSFAINMNVHFDLVSSSSCSSYDCEFVALASSLDIPLVTLDKKILKEFPKIAIQPSDF